MDEIKSGKPEWVLLAIPIFFFVWWISDLGFASIFGFGSLVFLLAFFVWIPNDQARKLNRIQRFAMAQSLVTKVREKIAEVKEKSVKKNMTDAINVFEGLITKLKSFPNYQGIIEDKLVPSLEDCLNELSEFIGDETGKFPVKEERRKVLYAILTHKDELFKKWQESGIDKTNYLTSTFRSRSEFEAAGINIEEGE